MSKIKNFSDYMSSLGTKTKRSLNHLVINGNHKFWFLGKDCPFEMHIYYSNIKEIILEIKIIPESIKIEDLKLTFSVKDDITKAYDWVKKNGHQIIIDVKK